MRISTIKRMLRRKQLLFGRHPDRFLAKVSGLIHVGANTGQERDLYDEYGLQVIWIEPIPEIYQMLATNIRSYPRQIAFQCLATDQDDLEYTFHVSNNDGQSSSILELKLHQDIWPEVVYERTISIRSTTLKSLLKREGINPNDYPALVMDTQGSELLVLKGAAELLQSFKFIKTEVPDFESYGGCCQLVDIERFLDEYGFREYSRNKIAERPEGGSYYDIVYQRWK